MTDEAIERTRVSSFPDLGMAERALADLLDHNQREIAQWLDHSPDRRRPFQAALGYVTGRQARSFGDVHDVTGVRAVLTQDPSMPEGFLILTGYPADVPASTPPILDLPGLRQLMAGYYHQDFDTVGDQWQNLNLFVRESPTYVPLIPAEVERLLSDFSDEQAIEACLAWLGCEIYPGSEVDGYRGWLEEIARRVQTRLAEQR